MRALVYEGPGAVAFRDVEAPTLTSESGALVRPTTVATCDLDRSLVRGLPGFDPPFVLGHEFVGEVVEVGPGVRDRRVGDTVAVSYQISCGECRMCARGVSSACRNEARTATYGLGTAGGSWGGALAESVYVPYADYMLAPVPPGVSARQAAGASDNVNDAHRCVAPALADHPGAPVLVVGVGAIPVMAADCARRLGSERVVLCSTDPAVCRRAGALGIDVDHVDRWPARFPNHPITVDCTSDPDGLRAVVASTEAGGRCTSVGMQFTDVALPLWSMYMKGITLHTSRTQGAARQRQVLAAMAAGEIDPLVVEPQVVAWDDAPDALLGDALKSVVERAAA
jgi:threonine dehydrogenase-like Zn-dependent dehydrogenase